MTVTHSGYSPATLKFRLSPLHARDQIYLVVYLVATPIVLLAFILWLQWPERDERQTGNLDQAVVQSLGGDLFAAAAVIGVVLGIGVVWWFFKSLQSATLRLTSTGVEMRQPGWIKPALMRQSGGDWRLGWHEIHAARLVLPGWQWLKPAHRLGQSRLVLDTAAGEKWLASFSWVDPDHDHRLRLREILFSRNLDVEQRLRDTALVRALEASGIDVEMGQAGAKPEAMGYDLSSHAGSLAMLMLFALAAGYALIDAFFLGRFKPLEPMPVSPFYLAGLAGVVLAALLGRGVPTQERVALSALTVAALVAAAWPGTLRYNALTAQPRQVTYNAVAPGVFEAPAGDFPEVDLRSEKVPEYWEQFPPGSEHDFTLLRGDAGFYQLDPGAFYRKTRAFYRQR